MESKLAKAMHEKGVTPRRLARDIDVSESYVYKLMRGERRPSLETAEAICRRLGFKGADLFLASSATNSSRPMVATSSG